MPDLTEAALKLAARGFHVFPLVPGGKRPLHGGGFHHATTDADLIRAWWREEPAANVGIYPAASGHVVLDVDRHGAVDGLETLRALEAKHGGLPRDMVVSTPSGGLHVYMALPKGVDIRSSAGKLGPGLDVRSTGGYVVGPGSVVDGREYEELMDL